MAVLANVLRQFEVSERTAGERAIRLDSAARLNHLVEEILNGIQRVRFYADPGKADMDYITTE